MTANALEHTADRLDVEPDVVVQGVTEIVRFVRALPAASAAKSVESVSGG